MTTRRMHDAVHCHCNHYNIMIVICVCQVPPRFSVSIFEGLLRVVRVCAQFQQRCAFGPNTYHIDNITMRLDSVLSIAFVLCSAHTNRRHGL
jgi:hypothetical protein